METLTIGMDPEVAIDDLNGFADNTTGHQHRPGTFGDGGLIAGSLTVANNLTVSGNVTVLGNVFSVSTTDVYVTDPLIALANNNISSDAIDIGLYGFYNAGTLAKTGLFRDPTTKEWMFFQGYTPTISSSNLITVTDPSFAYSNVNAAFFKGNVVANYALVGGINVAPYLVTVYGAANTSSNIANLAYAQANAAFAQANSGSSAAAAFGMANQAFGMANAAFAKANTGGGGNTTSSGVSITAVNLDTFTTTGSSNTFTLSVTPSSANNIIVNLNGIEQLNSSYTLGGNIVTLSEIPVVNTVVDIRTFSTNTTVANSAYNQANSAYAKANTGTTIGKSIAMSIVFGG